MGKGVIRDESDVRALIRAVYGSDVMWVEAARGGTAGAHDAVLHDGGAAVCAELKAWNRGKDGAIVAKLRPAQVRLHHVAAQRGWSSILVFGVVGERGLWALPSKHVPRDVSSRLTEGLAVPVPMPDGGATPEAHARAVRNTLRAVAASNGRADRAGGQEAA